MILIAKFIVEVFITPKRILLNFLAYNKVKTVSINKKYSLLKYYPPMVLDIVIRCFGAGIPSEECSYIADLSQIQVQKLYRIFRELIYVRQVAMQNNTVEIAPEIRKKIKVFAKRFETSEENFLKIAQKDTKFFNRDLDILDNHITESAKKFKVNKEQFVKVALKQSSLFYQTPDTLDKNITSIAEKIGTDKETLATDCI